MPTHYESIVELNQHQLAYFKSRTNDTDFDRKINASYDVAVARINSALLILIQYPLVADELKKEVDACQNTLEKFYDYTMKYDRSRWFKLYYKIRLHMIGKNEIPYIKSLLNTVEVKARD